MGSHKQQMQGRAHGQRSAQRGKFAVRLVQSVEKMALITNKRVGCWASCGMHTHTTHAHIAYARKFQQNNRKFQQNTRKFQQKGATGEWKRTRAHCSEPNKFQNHIKTLKNQMQTLKKHMKTLQNHMNPLQETREENEGPEHSGPGQKLA